MTAIRVFLVDDTAAVRHILTQILEEDPDITVVGTAHDGLQGLDRLKRVDVDLLVLDVEMPGMGGLEMLRQLRQRYPDLPVIVFSSITDRGAMVTIEALSLGASDYVTKPAMVGSAAQARDYIKSSLLRKIKVLFAKRHIAPEHEAKNDPPLSRKNIKRQSRVDLVVIASSMGGPKALGTLLPALPKDFPVPVLVVQHMPAVFTRALASRLNEISPLTVKECDHPYPLSAGFVLLAPGDQHLTVEKQGEQALAIPGRGEPVNFCRPAADILFASAARAYGKHVLAVVLTGMGQDGLAGCRELTAAGAQIIVQDQASSAVWGMAGSVARAGLPDAILPLGELPSEIMRRMSAGRRHSSMGEVMATAPGGQS